MNISNSEEKNIIDSSHPDHIWKKINKEWKRLQDLPELSNK